MSLDSSIRRRPATIATAPIGTFTKKIELQPACSVRRPPTSGPIASAVAETPTQIPIAVPRCRGGNAAVMIDSVAGFMSAAPTPCTTRAPIRKSALGASAHASEEPAKTASPATKTRRRPRRSASFPPVSSSAANVRA